MFTQQMRANIPLVFLKNMENKLLLPLSGIKGHFLIYKNAKS